MNFKHLLNKYINQKSFCVVGNSPTEIGKRNGENINSFKTVIRFNDYRINNFNLDYGKKTNIWVRATNDSVIETLEEKKRIQYDLIIIRAKNNNSNLKYRIFLKENNKEFIVLPLSYEVSLTRKLKNIPSLGLLFLYVLSQNDYVIRNENIFGFSFFDNQDIVRYGSHHYYNVHTNKVSKGIALGKHEWKAEYEFFNKRILRRK